MDIEIVEAAVTSALKSMAPPAPPENLLDTLTFMLRRKGADPISETELLEFLVTDDPNGTVGKIFHQTLAQWDRVEGTDWVAGSEPYTHGRRDVIFAALGLSEASALVVGQRMPPYERRDVVIETGEWEPWYTSERQAGRSFYWDSYRKTLERKLETDALFAVDAATEDIVARIADPSSELPVQAKGLVVGHVQSGKTTNFTGVIARAIDAGYRVVIVLTGTVELLRRQTQRRLDMELVGRENILGGRDPNDPEAIRDLDYAGDDDADWVSGKFVELGVDPSRHADIPEIRRLTTKAGDYKKLAAGLSTLDFRAGNELIDPRMPVWDPQNLFATNVRLAVVKKNKTVLEKLVRDLKDIRADLGEIPVLILDDEADQASVNTVARTKRAKGERSAINKLISEMIRVMPRAQYVGYTATPFANVFVNPDDAQDIFPQDFIVSLDPPKAYMGGKDFHDFDALLAEELSDPAFSNEAAHVRNVEAEPGEDDADLTRAIDMFVLTGAVKLWRVENGYAGEGLTRHHTMLVHESVRQAEHTELAHRIRSLFGRAAYSQPRSLARLMDLYVDDLVRVSESRDWRKNGLPSEFRDLVGHIGDAVARIEATGDPVTVVNGDKENEYNAVDFDTGPVWRILVGGTKLSRGFTVESLTVSYYLRRTQLADTLMQMGRWFGYRPGYRDLVRLYIGRAVPAARGQYVDLYDAFGAVIQDEQDFRDQLREFAKKDEDGVPQVKPRDVPPLVFQQLPWLRPTAGNKMFNVELAVKGEGGKVIDLTFAPARDNVDAKRDNFDLFAPVLGGLGPEIELGERAGDPGTPTYRARTAIVSADQMLGIFERLQFHPSYSAAPHVEMLRQLLAEAKFDDWCVVVPELVSKGQKKVHFVDVDGLRVPVLQRNRRDDEHRFSGSSPRQRAALLRIAGVGGAESRNTPDVESLVDPRRASMLLAFVADSARTAGGVDPVMAASRASAGDVNTLVSFVLPPAALPKGRVGFRAKRSGTSAAIVDRD